MIYMARPFDYEFRDKLLNYIKSEWMKKGEEPFFVPLPNIATNLTGQSTATIINKIWRTLDALENGGFIKIIKGEGSQPNGYVYINDKVVQAIAKTKEKINISIENYAYSQNQLTQNVINEMLNMGQEIKSLKGELEHIKLSLIDLEPFGIGPDDRRIYVAKKGSNVGEIINQIKQDLQNNNQQNNINQ
jgi:hypothetical protein